MLPTASCRLGPGSSSSAPARRQQRPYLSAALMSQGLPGSFPGGRRKKSESSPLAEPGSVTGFLARKEMPATGPSNSYFRGNDEQKTTSLFPDPWRCHILTGPTSRGLQVGLLYTAEHHNRWPVSCQRVPVFSCQQLRAHRLEPGRDDRRCCGKDEHCPGIITSDILGPP